jgi:hypothetical protein
MLARSVAVVAMSLALHAHTGGAQAGPDSTHCYRFDRAYFSWVGRPPGGGTVFADSSAVVRLSFQPHPASRFISVQSDARVLVPPTMRADSFTVQRWLEPSYWRALGPDSLTVVWRNGLYGPVFALRIARDRLLGQVRFTTDVAGAEKPPETARASRIDCPRQPRSR